MSNSEELLSHDRARNRQMNGADSTPFAGSALVLSPN